MPAIAAARLNPWGEIDRVIAVDGLPDAVLKVRYHLVQEMLARDPLSLFEIVPLSTDRANGHFTICVRDNCNVRLALAADDLELGGHAHAPSRGDSAERL